MNPNAFYAHFCKFDEFNIYRLSEFWVWDILEDYELTVNHRGCVLCFSYGWLVKQTQVTDCELWSPQ